MNSNPMYMEYIDDLDHVDQPPKSRLESLRDVAAELRRSAERAQAPAGLSLLRLGAALLPAEERASYLEEHRSYLLDLPNIRARSMWIFREVIGFPRLAVAFRTGGRRDRA